MLTIEKKQFLKIICPRCRNVQILYSKSSYEVKCNKCNYLLIKSRGGKAKIRAKVKEII